MSGISEQSGATVHGHVWTRQAERNAMTMRWVLSVLALSGLVMAGYGFVGSIDARWQKETRPAAARVQQPDRSAVLMHESERELRHDAELAHDVAYRDGAEAVRLANQAAAARLGLEQGRRKVADLEAGAFYARPNKERGALLALLGYIDTPLVFMIAVLIAAGGALSAISGKLFRASVCMAIGFALLAAPGLLSDAALSADASPAVSRAELQAARNALVGLDAWVQSAERAAGEARFAASRSAELANGKSAAAARLGSGAAVLPASQGEFVSPATHGGGHSAVVTTTFPPAPEVEFLYLGLALLAISAFIFVVCRKELLIRSSAGVGPGGDEVTEHRVDIEELMRSISRP